MIKLSQKIAILTAIVLLNITSNANCTKLITFGDAETLKARFYNAKLLPAHFIEKSKIAKELGGKKMDSEGLFLLLNLKVDLYLAEYSECIPLLFIPESLRKKMFLSLAPDEAGKSLLQSFLDKEHNKTTTTDESKE